MIDLDKNEKVLPVTRPKTTPSAFTVEQPTKMKKQSLIPLIAIFLVVAVGGFYTGSWLKTRKPSSVPSADLKNIQAEVPQAGAKVGDVFGSADEKSFKDQATGVLEKGGFNGEGTHKLVRTGGASQTVYLTSSTIDLDPLVGSQVTVWGDTFKGQKVGWLMDVGRAKVEALNAPLPD